MCLLQHISAEVGEGEGGWGEKLVKMGFRGDRPSVWAMQVREALHAKTQGPGTNSLLYQMCERIGVSYLHK
jgi:hypothetical protein